MTCVHCQERPANTTAGLCLPCDIELDRQVDAMERHLDKCRTLRHYEAVLAEAAKAVGQREPLVTTSDEVRSGAR